jgi:hypothetical protein
MPEHSEPSFDKPENYYEHLEKKFKDEEITYDNFKKVQIKVPFRMCIIGSTGSGKTNAVVDLIKKINAFDKIILIAKDLEEPIYAQFIDHIRKAEKDSHSEILIAGTKLEDLPKLNTIPTKTKDVTLLIVDDMITESNRVQSGFAEYWIRGRKKKVSCIYLSQSYFEIPKLIRVNSNYIILTKIQTSQDLHRILKEYKLGVTDEEMERMYDQATKDGFPNYFLIDLQAGGKNEELKFRKYFTPLKLTANEEAASKEMGSSKSKTFITAQGRSASTKKVPKKLAHSAPSHPLNVPIPSPPPEDASLKELQKYAEELNQRLKDGDITMEDVDAAMEDIEDHKNYPELMDTGEGIGKKKRKPKKIGSGVYKKKRAKLSTETEKQLERMLGFRVRPYW